MRCPENEARLEHGGGIQPEAIRAGLCDEGRGRGVVYGQHRIKRDIPKSTGLRLRLSLVLGRDEDKGWREER